MGMRVIRSVAQLRAVLSAYRKKGKSIGFVPTMGAFHEGHLSLMRRARKDNDVCVVSLYVNPKQFVAGEDLGRYPRHFHRDRKMINKENIDILFYPSDNTIYPKGFLTYIDVAELPAYLCGKFRPGHFRGVATIVAKLLNMVQPQVLYLGQKDAQQVAVLKAMVKDLDFPVKVKVLPTVREPDGLAMSSRNAYLSAEHRKEAVIIFKALKSARNLVRGGEYQAKAVIRSMTKLIQTTSGHVQYISCVDTFTLRELNELKGDVLIAVAVFFGKTRLIDNIVVRV